MRDQDARRRIRNLELLRKEDQDRYWKLVILHERLVKALGYQHVGGISRYEAIKK